MEVAQSAEPGTSGHPNAARQRLAQRPSEQPEGGAPDRSEHGRERLEDIDRLDPTEVDRWPIYVRRMQDPLRVGRVIDENRAAARWTPATPLGMKTISAAAASSTLGTTFISTGGADAARAPRPFVPRPLAPDSGQGRQPAPSRGTRCRSRATPRRRSGRRRPGRRPLASRSRCPQPRTRQRLTPHHPTTIVSGASEPSASVSARRPRSAPLSPPAKPDRAEPRLARVVGMRVARSPPNSRS